MTESSPSKGVSVSGARGTSDRKPDSTRTTPLLRRARTAVFLLFFANALAYASVVPRLPEIRNDIGLSNTALGTAIAAMPVGALVAGLSAGVLGARIGSGRLAALCTFGFALVLPLISLASAWWMLAGCLFLMGVLDAIMDVAMNAHGLRVQHGYGRSILSSFHALWSIGAVVGGLISTTLAGTGLSLGWHLLAIGALLVVLGVGVWPMLLPGPDEESGPREADTAGDGGPAVPAVRAAMAALPVVTMLGLLLVMSSVVEDTPASWGSALLQDDYRASTVMAGMAYVVFQTMMTIGRLLGDRTIDRYGRVAVARVGGLLIAVPLGLALLADSAVAVIIAFGCAGLGTATLFPAAMQAAGSIPGVRSGDGIAVVSWMARLGFLAGPPLVGLVGDRVNLRTGVSAVVIAGFGILLLASVLRPDARKAPGGTG